MEVYLVMASAGEYSDATTWCAGVFYSIDAAQTWIDDSNAFVADCIARYEADPPPRMKPGENWHDPIVQGGYHDRFREWCKRGGTHLSEMLRERPHVGYRAEVRFEIEPREVQQS